MERVFLSCCMGVAGWREEGKFEVWVQRGPVGFALGLGIAFVFVTAVFVLCHEL